MVVGGIAFDGIKITDFGIAKMAEAELAVVEGGDEEALTQSATALGALPFMAPEMIENFAAASRPADIWSVGALAYTLLTGSEPFGTSYRAVPAIQAAILPALPEDLLARLQFSELTSNIYEIIGKCLQKDPDLRPDADTLVGLCEVLCYSVQRRQTGVVGQMTYGTQGRINVDGAPDVFFHMQSVPVGTVDVGDRVWFSTSPGEPFERAFPVMKLKVARRGRTKQSDK